MKIPALSLALLALASAAPAGASPLYDCDRLAIHTDATVAGFGPEYSLDGAGCFAPGAGDPLAYIGPGATQVRVIWWHDVAGLENLTVVLDGLSLSPDPLPMRASAYREIGLPEEHVLYETDLIALPPGASGELTATVYQDGVALATTHARTIP